MAQPKTVHLSEAPALLKVTIPRVWVDSVTRVDQTSAGVKFKARPSPTQLRELVERMGWPAPSLAHPVEQLDTKLKGGHFILSASPSDDEKAKLKVKSKDGSVDTDAQVDIEYKLMSHFELHRMEIEGKRGKSFRWELRFRAASGAKDLAANVENYIMRTDNARGSLDIRYLEAPKQQPLDGVQATEEQRQAVMDLETA